MEGGLRASEGQRFAMPREGLQRAVDGRKSVLGSDRILAIIGGRIVTQAGRG